MNQQGKCLSMEQISRLHISIVDEDSVPLAGSSFYQQLDRRHAFTNGGGFRKHHGSARAGYGGQISVDLEADQPTFGNYYLWYGVTKKSIQLSVHSQQSLKSLQTHHQYSLSKQKTTEIDFKNSIAKRKALPTESKNFGGGFRNLQNWQISKPI